MKEVIDVIEDAFTAYRAKPGEPDSAAHRLLVQLRREGYVIMPVHLVRDVEEKTREIADRLQMGRYS